MNENKKRIEQRIREDWIKQFEAFANKGKMTVQQAATACGISMASYYRVRDGSRTPSTQLIAALVIGTGRKFVVDCK